MLSGSPAKYLLAMVLLAGVSGLIFLQYASAQYAKTEPETPIQDAEMKKTDGSPSAPLVQIAQGIAPSDVKCRDNLQLVFKSSNNMPACVKPSSAHRLVELGWAKPGDTMSVGTKPSQTIHKIDLSATENDDIYRWSDSDGINPTLTILANTENEIQIQNPTDVKHEFVIESEGKEVVASGDISADSSGKLTITPDATGTWEYHCEYHPSTMKGTIQIISP
ncbi:MAG: hypothetical protein EPO63_01975 [Candidatus Nitrosotenuis sp.]|nr:MAG: hypothetical protein EPO63_01975 [Candidatus Nitrosotenuis sp.]